MLCVDSVKRGASFLSLKYPDELSCAVNFKALEGLLSVIRHYDSTRSDGLDNGLEKLVPILEVKIPRAAVRVNRQIHLCD